VGLEDESALASVKGTATASTNQLTGSRPASASVEARQPDHQEERDGAVDGRPRFRDRFGWEAVGYGSVALGLAARSVPDEFRELAEKDL
jgi:hypothetical protein